RRVHGDPDADLIATAAEVGGVDQSRACGIELRHEGLAATAAGGLKGSRRRREVVRADAASHIGVARGIHGDPATKVFSVAAEVGGVHQSRTGGIELGYKDIWK